MKAVVCTELGNPELLAIEEVATPALSPGRVRIGVSACGVNFADTLIIAGKYQIKPPLPFTPGMEVAGTVVECGAGVTRCRVGERVMAILDYGGFAEQVVAQETDVFVLPEAMDFITAAGFPVTYGTSHIALKWRATLQPRETIVIYGASGGVGLTAVEIAKAMEAEVIASAGGEAKLAIAAARGADHLIDHRREDVRGRIKELTGGRGADVVYDSVGGDLFEASLHSINWNGRILIVGFASGHIPQIPANLLMVKNISAIGVHWGSYRKHDPKRLSDSFSELFSWFQEGLLKPTVSATFPLPEAAVALRRLLARKVTGKLVLAVQ